MKVGCVQLAPSDYIEVIDQGTLLVRKQDGREYRIPTLAYLAKELIDEWKADGPTPILE
jgi:hypothetical protein